MRHEDLQKDLPPAIPINPTHAKLAWLLVRHQFDKGAAMHWQNSLDVLDLFFGFDPRTRGAVR